MSNEKYKCDRCGDVVDWYVAEDRNECIFGGDRFEPAEYRMTCPCGGEYDEFVPCDSCDQNEPLDGYDDCAECILADRYSHTKIYDPIDYDRAREAATGR